MIEYPQHERLADIKDQSQAIGEFLEWCLREKGYALAEWGESRMIGTRMMPISYSTEAILAEFFGIDLKKLEAEKLAMLDKMRREQAQ